MFLHRNGWRIFTNSFTVRGSQFLHRSLAFCFHLPCLLDAWPRWLCFEPLCRPMALLDAGLRQLFLPLSPMALLLGRSIQIFEAPPFHWEWPGLTVVLLVHWGWALQLPLLFDGGVVYSRMLSKGFSFHSGGLGVEPCSRLVVWAFATVVNRKQPSATVRGRALRRSHWVKLFGEGFGWKRAVWDSCEIAGKRVET